MGPDVTTELDRRSVSVDEAKALLSELKSSLTDWLQSIYADASKCYQHTFLSSITGSRLVESLQPIDIFSEGFVNRTNKAFRNADVYKQMTRFLYLLGLNGTSGIKHEIQKNLDYIQKELPEKLLLAEAYILSLEAISPELLKLKSQKRLSLELALKRIKAVRTEHPTSTIALFSDQAKKVLRKRLLPLNSAAEEYENEPICRRDVVLAGGDATRYLKFLKAVLSVYQEESELSEEIFKQASQSIKYKDIKHMFNLDTLIRIFETPMFNALNVKPLKLTESMESLPVDEIISGIKLVYDRFHPLYVPKALNIAFQCGFARRTGFLSFFTASILLTYSEVLEERSHGNQLVFIVRNDSIRRELERLWKSYVVEGLFKEDRLTVKIMTTTPDAVPVSFDHRFFVFREDELITSSTGHGPAYIKALNSIYQENEHPHSPVSIRNIDNSGSHLAYYTGLVSRAASYENHLRNELVLALLQEQNPTAAELIGVSNNTAPGRLRRVLMSFVENRWDYRLNEDDSLLTMANKLADMPVTVAIVIESFSSTGGGLFVDRDQQMVIADRFQTLDEDTETRFNPMVFATILKKPLAHDMEDPVIFTSMKSKTGVLILQGESAATHLATCPDHVLKRVINVERKDVRSVFIEQKTLDQSHPENLIETTEGLSKTLRRVAKMSGITLDLAIDIIHSQEKKAIDRLHMRQVSI